MRLREVPTSDVVTPAVMFFVCVAVVVSAPWIQGDPGRPNPDRMLQLLYGFLGLFTLLGFFQALRRWRREIVTDEVGLALLDRGHLQWSLPWEEFGGWDIRKGRVVVLDRSGGEIGSSEVGVTGALSSGATANRRLFIGELEKHLPEGGFRPPPKGPPEPPRVLTTIARCLLVILTGVAVSIAGFYGLDQMLRGAREGDAANGPALWLWRHQAAWPLLLLPLTIGPFWVLQGGFTWYLLSMAPWNRDQDKGDTDATPASSR